MKLYELTYLIPTDLSEGERKTLSEKINSFIQENGGILEKIQPPLQQNLAYSVKKEASAFLMTLDFHAAPEKITEIEKKIKSESGILRYFITTKEIIKTEAKIPRRPPKSMIRPRETYPSTRREGIQKKKVELEEIDKKLKEILGE